MTTRNVPIGQLQTVINASAAGDILNLAPGIHTGVATGTVSIAVNKKLTIDGLDAATIHAPTRADATKGLSTLHFSAPDSILKRVKVTGANGPYNALVLQTAANLTLDAVVLEGLRPSDPMAIGTVFGIRNYRTSGLHVNNGEWSRMAQGVEFNKSGQNSEIVGVAIHDIDRMVVNDTTPGTDTGGNAFAFYHALGPIRIANCHIERLRAPSYDYQMDGSAFEMYGSGMGGVVIEDNEVVDALTICETGKGSADTDYDNVIMRRNIFRSTNPNQVSDYKQACNGLFMRSAKNWQIDDNEFRNLDWWMFAFDYSSSAYSGQLSNISAKRNTVYLKAGVNRWLSFDDAVALNVFTSADNKVYQVGARVAEKQGKGYTSDLATWRSWAPGQETGTSYWGPEVNPPDTCEQELAAARTEIDRLEGEVANLTSALAQANAATNAAQQQRDAYLAKLNGLRSAVTQNVADLNAANAAAAP